MRKNILIIVALLLSPMFSHAASDNFIKWHSTNVQLLKGWDYEVGEEKRSIMTIEHANGWKYGDFHMFIDTTRFDDGGSNIYGEFTPRISLSKVFDKDFSYGIVKDVLISTMLEEGEKSTRTWLYGGGIDLNISGFKFFKTNYFIRDDINREGKTWQVTLAWNRPFKISETRFLIEGFADFAGAEGIGRKPHQLIVPRFLVNIGDLTGNKLDNLWGGIEYSYWHNKFGLDGVTESNPQIQLKWTF